MIREIFPVPKRFNDEKCRRCDEQSTFPSPKILYCSCYKTSYIHEQCLVQELRQIKNSSPLMINHSQFADLLEYRCSKCKKPIFFRNDFSSSCVSCDDFSGKSFCQLIAVIFVLCCIALIIFIVVSESDYAGEIVLYCVFILLFLLTLFRLIWSIYESTVTKFYYLWKEEKEKMNKNEGNEVVIGSERGLNQFYKNQ